jgi:DNA-binding transcriptional MerR regulator
VDIPASVGTTRERSAGISEWLVAAAGEIVTVESLAESRHQRARAKLRRGEETERPGAALLERLVSAEHRRRGGGGSRGPRQPAGLLTEAELEALEAEHAEGITSAQLVAIFAERDVRLSEATFRKYVQRGLLPRSRRVGRKGKHRGSLGVYPAKTVRRVNAIKRLMGEGYTIEEIQDRFLRYTDLIEVLEESVEDVFVAFDSDLANPRFDTKARRSLKKEIAEARKTADDLLRRVGGLSERLSGPREDDLGPAGAAGSAEDLL